MFRVSGAVMFDSPFFTSEFFWLHFAIVFFFGTLFGSFINVCIYRLPAGKSIVWPNSHCFSCGAFIKWYDNIPLVSYLILRGRCRSCGERFSIRYFFIELLTGILFAWVFYRFRYMFATPVYLAFVGMMIVGTFTDLDHWIIPDSISIGGFGFGAVVALIAGFFKSGLVVETTGPFEGTAFYTPFLNSLAGAATGFFLLLAVGVLGTLAFRKDAMGGGDVKLMAFIGAILGWLNCLLVLVLASVLGSIIGVALILTGKISRSKSLPVEEEATSVETNSEEETPPEEELISELKKKKTGTKPGGYHHLPFGPYLAAASVAVLLYYKEINVLIERFFYIGY